MARVDSQPDVGTALRRSREPPCAARPCSTTPRPRASIAGCSAATTRCSAAGRARRSRCCARCPDATWIRGNGERWTAAPQRGARRPGRARARSPPRRAIARPRRGRRARDAARERADRRGDARLARLAASATCARSSPIRTPRTPSCSTASTEQRLIFGHTHVPFQRFADPPGDRAREPRQRRDAVRRQPARVVGADPRRRHDRAPPRALRPRGVGAARARDRRRGPLGRGRRPADRARAVRRALSRRPRRQLRHGAREIDWRARDRPEERSDDRAAVADELDSRCCACADGYGAATPTSTRIARADRAMRLVLGSSSDLKCRPRGLPVVALRAVMMRDRGRPCAPTNGDVRVGAPWRREPPRQSHEAVAFIVPTAGNAVVQRAPLPHRRRDVALGHVQRPAPAIDVPRNDAASSSGRRGSFAAAAVAAAGPRSETRDRRLIDDRQSAFAAIVARCAAPERNRNRQPEREQQAGQVAGRLGRGEVVPLRRVAAERAQAVDLAERLDALGDAPRGRTRARAR